MFPLLRGAIDPGYELMLGPLKLSKYFEPNVDLGDEVLHVLVELPTSKRDLTSIGISNMPAERKLQVVAELKKNCPKRGLLPTDGDFLDLLTWNDADCGQVKDITAINDIVDFTGSKFFVRKEILCVLQNFKLFKSDFDGAQQPHRQFVLLGSPGTGKSCVLALICFFIAVELKLPVLWHRYVSGGDIVPVTRLFSEGSYYEWIDEDCEVYRDLYDAMYGRELWSCLDDLDQKTVKKYSLANRFRLLATSGQYDVSSGAFKYVKMCMMPYWSQDDLVTLGRKIYGLGDEDIIERYFKSGGSLRHFVDADSRALVTISLKKIQTTEHAESLLTLFGSTSDKQIDCIRMQGVLDIKNWENYMDPTCWKVGITSLFALRILTDMVQPTFFQKLIGIAQGLQDACLEGIALEAYFHSVMRHHRQNLLRFNYLTYDDVDRRGKSPEYWEAIQNAKNGLVECLPPKLVKRTGESMAACIQVMNEWAANLSMMDYWIPATSLCETIDAVAKWRFPGEEKERICLLQLMKAAHHSCSADVLWQFAEPFVNTRKVCYIVLLPPQENDEVDIRRNFRLKFAVIDNEEFKKHISLLVATYQFQSSE